MIRLYSRLTAIADRFGPPILGTLARFVFGAVLAGYFWASALTKLGDGALGLFRPSVGAYAQIFPRSMEAVGFDISRLGWGHWAVVEAGILAEFLLPALILLGLATRPAALAMIGFIVVQSLTDIYGHGADAGTIGAWFDRESGSLILDQRALWTVLLLGLVAVGAGPLSADRLIERRLKA